MQLAAELTWGWRDDTEAPLAAARLHEEIASRADEDHTERLAAALVSVPAPRRILGLERLFRRHAGGYRPLRQLLGSLASLPAVDNADGEEPETLVCEIDAFAYGFLTGAKNLDLLLPCDEARNTGFRAARDEWERTWRALTEFERVGQPLPASCPVDATRYLAFRRIIVRPSARDERRSLATLLVSGPSTRAELVAELGVSDDLARRILAVLVTCGVVERRADGRHGIVPAMLALVSFGLRETMGLDLLGELPAGA